jgi:transposase-like protein
MSTSKSGVSAAQLEREIGVTYKTAWRMLHKIRGQMAVQNIQLKDRVEVDETYIHANVFKRSTAQFRYGPTGARTGQIVFGMVEREGAVILKHVAYTGATELQGLIKQNVKPGTTIYTDSYKSYYSLSKRGYKHFTTNHSKLEHVNGDNHTQNIENVWSHLKRTIKGCHRTVSPKYLQLYCNEISFKYSYRKHPYLFWVLMQQVATPVSGS